jgi:Disulphide bond corrector protein DsbC/AhpC/TSA family
VLRGFAEKHGITYTLLSDEGSKVIRELGLLNDHVYEHHAAYGVPKQDRHWGVPYPGAFLLDAQGYVIQKRFQQSYRERETGVGIFEQGFGGDGSIRGPEAVGQSEGVKVRAHLDSATYRFFQRLWLTVELLIDPGLHVYGRPLPEGYIPLSIAVAPLEGLIVGEPRWPAPHPYRVEGLDEEFSVYEGNVAVSLPLTFTQEGDDRTLHVTVRYQACSDTDCFLPSTITLQMPVKAADLVERPRRQ